MAENIGKKHSLDGVQDLFNESSNETPGFYFLSNTILYL